MKEKVIGSHLIQLMCWKGSSPLSPSATFLSSLEGNELSPVFFSKSEISHLGTMGASIYQVDCFFGTDGKKGNKLFMRSSTGFH